MVRKRFLMKPSCMPKTERVYLVEKKDKYIKIDDHDRYLIIDNS